MHLRIAVTVSLVGLAWAAVGIEGACAQWEPPRLDVRLPDVLSEHGLLDARLAGRLPDAPLEARLLDARVWLAWADFPTMSPSPRDGGPSHATASVPQVRDVPKAGSEVWIPLGSFLLPGLGQYSHGAIWPGIAYSATTVTGVALSVKLDADLSGLPRDGSEQLGFEAGHVAASAAMLSTWDAFHRAMPALQAAGRYEFLGPREELSGLLTAPLDVRFLTRWSTLLDLTFSAAVAGWLVTDRSDDVVYEPFRAHDAAFITSLSLNAAVSEEALFRGWLLPMLHQKLGGRFWAANGIQAALFGAAHLGQASEFALVIGASALYSGWFTRRNDWSIREAIFNHFWYDMLVGTAELLSDEARPITLMPISIRF